MSRQRKFSTIDYSRHPSITEVARCGFFVDVTSDFLQESCMNEEEEEGPKEVDQLLVLWMDSFHIRNVGPLGDWCPKLRVCILSNNHLTSVYAFSRCVNLVKLDIHGNRLSNIPDEGFWLELKHLEFLYLHDNPIASVDTVSQLAFCPRLTGLTLYDTPLSLIDKYRHHVVNTVVTLKALDHYVIADQEIIENLRATKRFGAFTQKLKINLCPSIPLNQQKTSSSSALKHVVQTRRNINHIMAHHSPVIMIQKYIRSYLTKLRLKQRPKIGLMVTTSLKPKPLNDPQFFNVPLMDMASVLANCSQPKENESTEFSSECSNYSLPSLTLAPPQSPVSEDIRETRVPKNSFDKLPKTLSFSCILEHLNESGEWKTKGFLMPNPEEEKIQRGKPENPAETKRCEKSHRIKTADAFPMTFMGDEIPLSNFCVQGLKKHVNVTGTAFADPEVGQSETDSSGSSKIGGNSFLNEFEPTFVNLKKAKPKRPTSTFNEHFQNRILKQVNLSRLFAIQKAYQDQYNANSRKAKTEETQKRSSDQRIAQEQCRTFREERRGHILQEKEILKEQIRQGVKQNAIKKTQYLEKKKESHNKSQMAVSRAEEEASFVQEFSKRQLSISRVLLRHDKQQMTEQVTSEKAKLVKEIQNQLHSNLEKTKNFRLQSIVYLQAKHNEQHTKLRNSLTKLSFQKLKDAQQRVDAAKNIRKHIVPYTLPLITLSELSNNQNINEN